MREDNNAADDETKSEIIGETTNADSFPHETHFTEENAQTPRELKAKPKKPILYMYSAEETKQQVQVIESLLLQGTTNQSILADACARVGLRRPKTHRVSDLIKRIHQRWAAEDAAHSGAAKATAIRRLHRWIGVARGKGAKGSADYSPANLPAIARFEELLSKIQGTQEPIRISVDLQVTEAVVAVIGTMSVGEMNAALARMADLRAKASAFEARSNALVAKAAPPVLMVSRVAVVPASDARARDDI